jgi:hypothetical protein
MGSPTTPWGGRPACSATGPKPNSSAGRRWQRTNALVRCGGGTDWNRLEQAAQPSTSAPRHAITTVELHQQPGGLWLVGSSGHEVSLPNLRGFHHLRALIARPDAPVDVLRLVSTNGRVRLDEPGMELLDDQARRAYRSRLIELQQEIDDADLEADLGRRERLSNERKALLEQLSAAAGLGGRSRSSGSSRERARIAVRKSITAAAARIAEADPWLGRHLCDHVRAGAECRYESDPDRPIRWVLE